MPVVTNTSGFSHCRVDARRLRFAVAMVWLLAVPTAARAQDRFDVMAVFEVRADRGLFPFASLLEGRDGNVYGTTAMGGDLRQGYGTLFKIDTSGALTTLHVFNGWEGAMPYGRLFQATDGSLYGTTFAGGVSGDGAIFKLDPSGTLTTLHVFRGSDGSNPYGGVIQASNGSFYGTTLNGGAFDSGTVFKLDVSGTLTTLHSFDGTTGSQPYAGLIQANDGNLFTVRPPPAACPRGVPFSGWTPRGR